MRLPLVFLATLLCGCNITFTTTIKGKSTIEGSPLGGFFDLFPQMNSFSSIDFNANQDFQNNNAQKQHVKEAKVTSFTLKITEPNNQNYDFLDSVAFAVNSPGNNESQLAHKEGIPSLNLGAPNPTLTLDVPGEDISAHIRADTVTFVSSGKGRQPGQDVTVEATVTLLIGVGL